MPNVQQGASVPYSPATQRTAPVAPTTPVQATPPTEAQQPQTTAPASQPSQPSPAPTPGETAQQEGQQAVNEYQKEGSKPPRLSLLAGYSFSPNYSGSVDGAQKFKVGVGYNLFTQKFGEHNQHKFKLDGGLGLSNTQYQTEVTDPTTGYTKEKDKSTFSVDADIKAKCQFEVAKFKDKQTFLFVTPTAMAGVGVDFSGNLSGSYGGGASVGVANKSGWSFGLDANYTNKGGFLGASLAIPLGR